MEAKYKVGDTVYIKSLDWYNRNKVESRVYSSINKSIFFSLSMSRFCSESAIVIKTAGYNYFLELTNLKINPYFVWTEDFFEDIKEIRKKKIKKLYEIQDR